MRYGISDTKWLKAKNEIRELLESRARARGSIPYSELVGKLKTIRLAPDSHVLSDLLDDISTESDERGEGMLSVIVVHKYGDMQPGKGFFKLAKRLGREFDDPVKCWIEEFSKVHAVWAAKR